MARGLPRSRTVFGLLCAALLLTSVLPARLTPFAGWFNQVAELLVSPVQRPVAGLIRWFRGPAPQRPTDEAFAQLATEVDLWKLAARQAQAEAADLRRQIAQYQRGLLVSTGVGVAQLIAPVVGMAPQGGTTLVKVQVGERNGVVPGSVVVTDAVNLVGRVTRVDPRLAWVTPISERVAGSLGAVIIPSDQPPAGPGDARAGDTPLACRLEPDGRGRLSGPVEWVGVRAGTTGEAPRLTAGMTVRLSDPAWPASAQMLVVGRVEEVQTSDAGRTRVVVRPLFDLARLAEVTIRMGADAEGGAGGGAP